MDELKARRANLASAFLKELIVAGTTDTNSKGDAALWCKMIVSVAFRLADEFILQSEDL